MNDFREAARKLPKGHLFEDFAAGQVFNHHWGRTLNEGDNTLFTTLTMSYNPLYFNAPYARAHGHRRIVVNPMLVFLTVFGLSVEDLSEAGGLFLGVDNLTFHRTVYAGDTLIARSTVTDKRASQSRPELGIVTWHTQGFLLERVSGETSSDGSKPIVNAASADSLATGSQASPTSLVVDFRRSNLIPKRGGE